MARDYFDESKKKKKKETQQVQKAAKSPSVKNVNNTASKSTFMGGGAAVKNTEKAVSRSTTNRSQSFSSNNQPVKRQPSGSRTNSSSLTAAQRQKMGLNDQYTAAERQSWREKSQARLQQARTKKMGLAPEDQASEAQKRALRNTPSLMGKAIKDAASGYGQTLTDVIARTASSERGTEAKAMKMGIEKGTKQYQELEEERKRTAEEARKDNRSLYEKMKTRQAEWDEKTKDAKGLEKAYYGAVESGTGMAADTAIGALTGTGQVGALASMGLRTYGSSANQARAEGATEAEAGWYGLAQAAKEMGTEAIGGGGLAKVAYGKGALGLGDIATNTLIRNLKGQKADLANMGVRLLGDVAEENIEEFAGWTLDPWIKELTYGRNVRGRDAQTAMRDKSNALRAEIQNDDDARAAAAYLSSDDFLQQTMQDYIASGLKEKDAAEVAERMRDYLTASLTGDTDSMQKIEDEVSRKVAKSHNVFKDYSFKELKETFEATSLLVAATGLPANISTMNRGNLVKEQLGDEGVRALANTAIDFEDSTMSTKAEAMKARIDSGKELTGTQAYELMSGMQEQVRKDTEREQSSRRMAAKAIETDNLLTPYRQNENGGIDLDAFTEAAYRESANKASAAIESFTKEAKESITDTEKADGSKAIAGFQTGVFTVDDANALNYSNTVVRAAFENVTGVNLGQYIVRNKKGEVDIPATNTKTKDALFAMAADNLVKSAQADTKNWMDVAKGEVVTQVSARMGARGSEALQMALDDVDERDRSKYMMTANATDMLYQAARNMGTEWSSISTEATKMFPGISETKLKAMYEAGLADREMANDKMRGRQIRMGEALSEMGEQETSTGKVFIDTEVPPKGTVIRTFTEIAKNLGADIHFVDYIYDNNGDPIKGANGSYDPKTNTFYLNVSTGVEKNIGYIFMHETTHYLKRFAPEQYQALENLVRERWFAFNPSQMQDAIANKIEAYKRVTKGQQVLTEDEALEEIIADAAHDFINDPEFAKQVAEEDMGLAKAVLDSIRNALRMLRNIFASGTIDDETHMNSLFRELDILSEAERLWLDAYKVAVRNSSIAAVNAWQDNANAQSSLSISDTSDANYMAAVESGDMETAQRMVDEAALASMPNVAKAMRGRLERPIHLYHGTNAFGFTQFKDSNYEVPFIYTSTDRTVSAHYAGDQHYASPRPIGKPYREGESIDDLIENANTVWQTNYHVMTSDEKKARYNEVIDEAKKIADKIDELDVPFDSFAEGDDYSFANAVDNVKYLFWIARDMDDDFYYNFDEDNGYREESVQYHQDAVDGFERNIERVREYYYENRNNLTDEQKKLLSYLIGYEVGDAAIDMRSVLKVMTEEDRLMNEYGYGRVPSEMKETLDSIHNIAAYELFGDLGERPFEFDANGAQFYGLKVPEVSDDYVSTDYVCKWAYEHGYTSVIMHNIYDYGDKADNYVFFNSSQLKSADPVTYDDNGDVIPLSERFNTESQDIRFSLSEPVERVADLIAVHNLKPDDIRNTFELGGFPMPSIAITKDSMGHDLYGDITLMFHSDTVDPEFFRSNQVFGGDAWTPTFPTIAKKVSRKVADKVDKRLKDILGLDQYDYTLGDLRLPALDDDNLTNALRYNEPYEAFKNDEVFQIAYLKNAKNFDVAVPTKEGRIRSFDKQALEYLDDNLPELTYNDIYDTVDHTMKYEPAVRKARKDYYENKGGVKLKALAKHLDEEMGYSDVISRLEALIKFREEGIPEVTDRDALKNILDKNVDQEGYKAWIDNLFEGIIEKTGIRNDKDMFTPSGNRRSWESLHDPVTLENVVKVMKTELAAGGTGIFGSNPKGAAQKQYKSLDEIRADEGRLQNLSEEEYKAKSEEAVGKMSEVCIAIAEHNPKRFSNSFGAALDVGSDIAEILNSTRNRDTIQRKLKKDYWLDVTDEQMDDLMEAIDAIANLPTGYFEAKPRRAVGFDEVRAAVIPANTDADIKEGFSKRGITTYEYDPEVEGDRTAKVNDAASEQDLRFSISENSSGESLTEWQQEYFRNSKIVDEDGRLKIMYHGTPNMGFTVFDLKKAKPGTLGRGFYFTDSKTHAGNHGQQMEVYLNIENPLQPDTYDITKEQLRQFVAALAEDEDYGIDNYGYDATVDSVTDSVWGRSDFQMLHDLNLTCVGDLAEACRLFNYVNGTNYDGIVTAVETLAMRPEQIKLTDNLAPTSDPDIRFSVSDDEYLSAVEKYQQLYDSNEWGWLQAEDEIQRMVDQAAVEAGYATKAYHGTDAEFNVFKRDYIAHGRLYGDGFYFSPLEEIAGSYGSNVKPYFLKTGVLTERELMSDYLAAQDYKDFADKDDAIAFSREKRQQFEKYGQGIERFRPDVDIVQGMYRVIYTTVGAFQNGYIMVATEPEYIKSAEPIVKDDNGNVIPLSKRFNDNSVDTRFSISATDSQGNRLTEEQRQYFGNSQAVDDQGRLVPVYHTTNKGGFTIFDPMRSDDHRSLFFAEDWDTSQTYGNYANSRFYYYDIDNIDDVKKYLDAYSPDRYFVTQEQFDQAGGWEADMLDFENVTNGEQSDFAKYLDNPDGYIAIIGVPDYSPDNTSYADTWVMAKSPDELVRELHNHFGWQRENYRMGTQHGYYACYLNLEDPYIIDAHGDNWNEIHLDDYDDDVTFNTREIAEMAMDMDFDGVIIRNLVDHGGMSPYDGMFDYSDIYIAFSSNQVKDINNENPTENPDIRYSVTEDEAMSNAAHDYAYDNSYEALAYYEDLIAADASTETTYEKAKNYIAKDVDEFYAGLTRYADGMKFDDPVLEEGRTRMARSKHDYFNSNVAKWNDAWLTDGEVLDPKSIKKPVKDLVMAVMSESNTNRKYKTELVNKAIIDIRLAYFYAKNGRTDVADALLWHSAHRMIDGVEFYADDTSYEEYKGLRDYMKNTRIQLGEEYWSDVDFGAFRKENFGRMNLVKGETNVDKIYAELEDMYPGLFDSEEYDNAPDQLMHMASVLDSVQPYAEAYSSEYCAEWATDIASDLLDIMQNGKELQSIADRYTNKYEAKIKAMKARHAEAMLKVRQQRDEGIKREKVKFKEYVEKKKEQQAHSKLFNRIVRTHKKLTDRLTSNTADSNIPEQYKKELARLLAAFDLQTVGSKKYEARTGRQGKKSIKLAEIKAVLNNIESNSGEFFVNDAITDIIDDLLGKDIGNGHNRSIEGLTIDELNSSELARIDKLLRALLHEFNTYRNVKIGVKRQQVADIGHAQTTSALEHAKIFGSGKDYRGILGVIDKIINMDELTPSYLFRRIDPNKEGMWLMYEQLEDSHDRYIRNTQQLTQWVEEIVGEYHHNGIINKSAGLLDDWRSENYSQTFKLESGETISLTPAQMMSIYCLNNRTQAKSHMLNGGVVIAPVSYNAKILSDLKKRANTALPKTLTDADISKIITSLSDEQINVAQKLQKLMAEKMAAWGNEASMNVLGIELFGEPDYFPIKSDKAGLISDLSEDQFVEAIRSFGFTKAVKPGAGNAIMVNDIFDVVVEHCNNMNLYNAYSEAINDFMKVFNYKEKREEGTYTVKQAIAHAYSQKATSYIMSFMKDLNGNVSGGKNTGINDAFNMFLANAKKASVFANIRVAAQQPTAIGRVFQVIDPKYAAAMTKPEKGVLKEMFEHCPIALWKSWGYYDINMGRNIEDVIMNNNNFIEDVATKAYGELDNMTWGGIWQMVKAETEDKHSYVKKGSDEYWDLCNRRMREVVAFTQVVDSPFHRSHAMRSKNFMDKLATAFGAEPTLTFNMVRDGYVRAVEMWKTGDKAGATKLLTRTITVFGFSAALTAAAAALPDVLRGKDPGADDDDDGERTVFERWWANTLANFKDNINLLNNIYYVKDVKSILEGWEINNLGLQGWKYIGTAIQQLSGSKYARSKDPWWKNLFYGMGYLTGVPAKTIMTDFGAMFNKAKEITGIETPLLDSYLASLSDISFKKDDSSTDASIGGLFKGSTAEAADEEVEVPTRDSLPDDLSDEQKDDIIKAAERRAGKVKAAEEQEKRDYDTMLYDAIKASTGYKGEEFNKKIWQSVSKGYTERLAHGDYFYIDQMRKVVEDAGGDVEYFDQRVFEKTKSEFKKKMVSDLSPEDSWNMEKQKHYLTTHGMTDEQLSSEIVYKSDMAKDLKVAFRINDEEAIKETSDALALAGLTRQDFERIYKNRNRIDLTKYDGKYKDKLKSTGTFIWPTNGTITSYFGYRNAPTAGASSNHPAIDIGAPMGTDVVAADGGVVIYVGQNGGYGKSVGIKHDNGMVTYYNHLSSWDVNEGDTVAQGQHIANVGSTGISTGPHLDFKVLDASGEPVDPLKYLENKKS